MPMRLSKFSLPTLVSRTMFPIGLATSSLIFACGCLWLNTGVRQTFPVPQADSIRGLAMTIENLPGEEWRPVVGWESLYEVSNVGRIRSFPRTCWNGRVEWLMPPRIMHDYRAFKGYRYVTLNTGLKPSNRLVHQVVLTAFMGMDPARPIVNHKDGNKTNNRLDNLEWCTAKENVAHALNTGLNPHRKRVVCVDKQGVPTEYASMADARKRTRVHRNTMLKSIATGTADVYGRKWEFV